MIQIACINQWYWIDKVLNTNACLEINVENCVKEKQSVTLSNHVPQTLITDYL